MEELDASFVDEFIEANAGKTQGELGAILRGMVDEDPGKALQLLGGLLERFMSGDREGAEPATGSSISPDEAKKMAIPAIEALGRVKDRRAANILLLASEGTKDKEVRKRARAMLFQLRSWGVEPNESALPHEAVPGQPVAEGQAAKTVEPVERLLKAIGGLPNSQGDMDFHVLARTRPGELEHLMFVVTEKEGFRAAFKIPSSRKRFAAVVETLRSQSASMRIMAEVEFEFPVYVIGRALTQMQNGLSAAPRGLRGEVDPATLSLWQELIGEEKVDRHPVYNELDPEEIKSDSSLLVDSQELVRKYSKHSRWWEVSLSEDDVSRLRTEVVMAHDGLIQTNPLVRLERFSKVFTELVEKAFGLKEQRTDFAERMENVAYILKKAGFEDDARMALAVSLALRDGNVSISHIPFLSAAIVDSLGLELKPREGAETSPDMPDEDEDDQPGDAAGVGLFVPGPGGKWVRR